MKEGYVLCDGQPIFDASVKVRAGEVWVVQLPYPVPADPKPRSIPLDVVFEDSHLIVIEKPAGMVVHPAYGHRSGTLINALLHHVGAGPLSGDEIEDTDDDDVPSKPPPVPRLCLPPLDNRAQRSRESECGDLETVAEIDGR